MKLSTRTRYGTRALVELARAYPEQYMSVRDLAECQRLSAKYLESILVPLKAADIVQAVRGVNGGYRLSRPPGEISLSEIYSVLEGSCAPVACIDSPDVCEMAAACPTRHIWTQLGRAILAVLEDTTLAQLAEDYDKRLAVRQKA